jgi:hypothetical protein
VARWSYEVFVGLGTVMVYVVMNVADQKARQDGFRGRLCLRKA